MIDSNDLFDACNFTFSLPLLQCEVDFALQTLVSKIKERELESQRALSEHDVANRLLKHQLQELQSKLKEKEYQLADANEVANGKAANFTWVVGGIFLGGLPK